MVSWSRAWAASPRSLTLSAHMTELNEIQLGERAIFGQRPSALFFIVECSCLISCYSVEDVLWCHAMELTDELTRLRVCMLNQSGRKWISSVPA